ncbi:Hpt domain-containing protein [Herbaspirillum camelliae]|uniref:Hpt domain-containing protein n=1 Tax=Herbaspirillum camelliae TaxID=1892903 RepID=UPI000949CCA3|nr:Hpt domain-containing protein [Herbaspirillum camelliae]
MQPGQDPHQYRHIDPSALLQAVGGDARTVASLARTFADSAPAIFARLAQAARAGNPEATRHESHALKGMSALFNARALTERLQQTEAAARAGSLPPPEQWTQLQACFDQALEEIRCYAQSAGSA